MNDAKRYPVKTRFDLLDPEFLRDMALIMAVGADKYGDDNWKKGLTGMNGGINHAYGHLYDYQADLPNDYGPRYMHLAQVAVNAMFEAHFERERHYDSAWIETLVSTALKKEPKQLDVKTGDEENS